MGETEDDSRQPDGHMGILEPLLQEILDADAEEKFLAEGGHQGQAKEGEQRVALSHQGFHRLLRSLANLAQTFGDVPSVVPNGEPVDERHQEEYAGGRAGA